MSQSKGQALALPHRAVSAHRAGISPCPVPARRAPMDDNQGGTLPRLSRLLIATLVLALAGCTSAKQMTTPDGRQGYTGGVRGACCPGRTVLSGPMRSVKAGTTTSSPVWVRRARLLPLNRSTSTTVPRTTAVWSLPARGLDPLSAPGASRGRLLLDSPPAVGLHTRSLTTVPELLSCTVLLTTLRPSIVRRLGSPSVT